MHHQLLVICAKIISDSRIIKLEIQQRAKSRDIFQIAAQIVKNLIE